MVDVITSAYAHLCGQERGFLIDGAALPVCHRCLGLYVGAAVTFGWWVAADLWRRGLPTGRIVVLHAVLLTTAMLSGLHVLDGGATWRLLCGAWTGQVVLLWLAGSARHLWHASRAAGLLDLRWTRRDELHAVTLCVVVTILGCAPQWWLWIGWWPVSGLVIAGTLALVLAVGAAILATATWVASLIHAGLRPA